MNVSGFVISTEAVSTSALKTVLWPLLGVAFAMYIVVSLALLYHWRQYGMRSKRIILAETAYFLVSAVAFFIAVFSLILI